MESLQSPSLKWFVTDEALFPGCMDCCNVVGSPPAHEAAAARELTEEEVGNFFVVEPVFRETVETWHVKGHSLPTPEIMPKQKRKPKAITSE